MGFIETIRTLAKLTWLYAFHLHFLLRVTLVGGSCAINVHRLDGLTVSLIKNKSQYWRDEFGWTGIICSDKAMADRWK